MTFANPKAPFLLFLTMATLAIGLWRSKQLRAQLERWISPDLWPSVIPLFSHPILRRKNLFFGISLVLLALAAGRPQWGQREETIESRGIDVLFVLDLSTSMLAEDVLPSRLGRARAFIRSVLQNLGDDRAGVVPFAERAFLTVPLTNDFDYVLEMTETLEPSNILSQGTEIGPAIEVAIQAFERGSEDVHKQSRAVILISDGEDFGKNALAAASRLKEFGAEFFTVSVGTSEGAPIPIRAENGVLQTYKKDSSQKPVLTKVNRALLTQIAEAGGGKAVDLVNPDDAAFAVTKSLKAQDQSTRKSRVDIVRIDRFPIFLGLAVLFFILHLSTGYRPFRVTKKLLLIALLFHSLPGQASDLKTYLNARSGEAEYQKKNFDESAKSYEKAVQTDRSNPALSFNRGTALARGKNNEEAVVQFQEATKQALASGDFEVAAKSLYNEGLIHSETKNMKEAYDRLTKAIEVAKRSAQPEVEANARKALAQAVEKQKQQPQPQQNQQNQGGSPPEESKSPPKSPSSEPQENGRKRQFKGATLSKDVAESIMNDLSDREKQLMHKRLNGKKSKEAPHEKDW